MVLEHRRQEVLVFILGSDFYCKIDWLSPVTQIFWVLWDSNCWFVNFWHNQKMRNCLAQNYQLSNLEWKKLWPNTKWTFYLNWCLLVLTSCFLIKRDNNNPWTTILIIWSFGLWSPHSDSKCQISFVNSKMVKLQKQKFFWF